MIALLLAGCVTALTEPTTSDTAALAPPEPVESVSALTAYTVERACADLEADPIYFEPADVVMWQAEICWHPDQPIPDYVPGYGRRKMPDIL